MSGRLLRPKEACQRLGISYGTLHKWIKEGKIKAVRSESGYHLIPEEEVERILERRQEPREQITDDIRYQVAEWAAARYREVEREYMEIFENIYKLLQLLHKIIEDIKTTQGLKKEKSKSGRNL